MDGASGNKAFVSARCLGARCLVSHVSASISQRPRRCPDNIICAFVNLHSLGQRNKLSTSFVENLVLHHRCTSIERPIVCYRERGARHVWLISPLPYTSLGCLCRGCNHCYQAGPEWRWLGDSLPSLSPLLPAPALEIYSRKFAWGQVKLEPVKNYTAIHVNSLYKPHGHSIYLYYILHKSINHTIWRQLAEFHDNTRPDYRNGFGSDWLVNVPR